MYKQLDFCHLIDQELGQLMNKSWDLICKVLKQARHESLAYFTGNAPAPLKAYPPPDHQVQYPVTPSACIVQALPAQPTNCEAALNHHIQPPENMEMQQESSSPQDCSHVDDYLELNVLVCLFCCLIIGKNVVLMCIFWKYMYNIYPYLRKSY